MIMHEYILYNHGIDFEFTDVATLNTMCNLQLSGLAIPACQNPRDADQCAVWTAMKTAVQAPEASSGKGRKLLQKAPPPPNDGYHRECVGEKSTLGTRTAAMIKAKSVATEKMWAAFGEANSVTEDDVMFQSQGEGDKANWVQVSAQGVAHFAAQAAVSRIQAALDSSDYSASDCATKENAGEAEANAVDEIRGQFAAAQASQARHDDNHGCPGDTYPVAYSHTDSYHHQVDFMCLTASELAVAEEQLAVMQKLLTNTRTAAADLKGAVEELDLSHCHSATAEVMFECLQQAELEYHNMLADACYVSGTTGGDLDASSTSCLNDATASYAEAKQVCIDANDETFAPTASFWSPTMGV